MSEQNFRDKLTTVGDDGKKLKVYPQKPKGRFFNYRQLFSYSLLAFLFIAPFIKIGNNPLVLLDIINRKFILLGVRFWPQDFFILGLIALTLIVFIVVFTAIFGRVFCGWACPQTIFLEMLFRRIEYLIEGDYTKQKKLDKSDWTTEKIIKKGTKHTIFLVLSFLIANTFLAYIIGVEELGEIVTSPPTEHLAGFGIIIVFSGVFYGVFAYFREQVCTMACPYGRMQSVLLDESSIVVAYDNVRGEPRGKLRKNTERTEGSCIDCNQCVQVCPTAIDIRHGTQLECINCTACIDACDAIMDKIEQPRGLIRYDSLKGINEGRKTIFTPRVKGYLVLLTALLVFVGWLLVNRTDIDATILRTQGKLYQKTESGQISNLFNIKIINKTETVRPISIELLKPKGKITIVGKDEFIVPAGGYEEGIMIVEISPNDLKGMSSKIEFAIYDENGELIEVVKTKFLGPVK